MVHDELQFFVVSIHKGLINRPTLSELCFAVTWTWRLRPDDRQLQVEQGSVIRQRLYPSKSQTWKQFTSVGLV